MRTVFQFIQKIGTFLVLILNQELKRKNDEAKEGGQRTMAEGNNSFLNIN